MVRLLLTIFLLQAGLAQALPGNNAIFVQNKGQWPAEVRFRVDVPGGFLSLKEHSLHYVFYDTKALADHHASGTPPKTDLIRAHGVEVQLTGSQTPTGIEGLKPASVSLNYFLGNNPARHVNQAPAFGEIIYHDIYPGIDLRIYTLYQTLKYEFIVRPDADPARIRLTYAGADAVKLVGGKLAIQTSVTTFQEKEPYSYVSRDNRAVAVKTDWAVTGNEARFVLPNGYDKTQPLTIDPELVFVTYSGSRSDNWAHSATYDAGGNLYAGGSTFGVTFPVTTGAFQVNFGGLVDVAVLKFSPDGSNLLYSTYVGGQNADLPHSLIVNNAGELVVMGTTSSPDFPVTAGAYQTTPGLNPANSFTTSTSVNYSLGSDLFLVRLSANGQQLRAGTLVGGTGTDGIGLNRFTRDSLVLRNYGDDLRGEVIVGPDDDVYVASVTASTDFPVTDKTTAKGGLDAVVFRLSADLNQLRWSTRIGGSRFEGGNGLELGATGILYVCGVTNSIDLPATATAFQPKAPGSDNGFVARFDNQQLTQLTYLGTEQADGAYLIDTGPDGTPHIFGLSRGRYPVSAGVFSSAGSGQFIQALDANLTRSVFSTVIGSGRTGPDISPTAFLVNECGNIYLAGWGGIINVSNGNNQASSTRNMPLSDSTYQSVTNGNNFYLGVLERGAKSLLYGTFLGGPISGTRGDHVDGGTCRFDKNGIIYHAACVCRSSSFPATPTAWSRTNNSENCNNVAFKFDTDKLKAAFDTYAGTQKNVVEGCTPLALTFRNTSIGGKRYEWEIVGQAKSTSPAQTSFTFTQPGRYVVKLRAYNPLTCRLVDSTEQIINIRPGAFNIAPDTTICAGQSVQLLAAGGTTYRWANNTGLSSTTVANPIATPNATTPYSVTITNAFGCSAVKTQTVRQDVSFTPMVTVKTSVGCGQPMQLAFTNTTPNADRFVWTLGNGDTLRTATPANYSYAESGRYEITVTAYRNGCPISTKLAVDVENLSQVPNVITANNDGKNDVFTVGLSNAKLQIVNRWGRLIYENNQYQNDWGRNVPNGMYYFLLTTAGGVECKGWLQVLE